MGIWGSLSTRLRRGTAAIQPDPPPAAFVSLHLVPIDPGDRPDLPFGIWPDDADTVPAWRIEVERKADLRGLVIPPYRTRRQFEAAVEACAAALKEPAPRVILEPLAPAEAARQFLSWLRTTSRTGRYTDETLSEIYREHCLAVGRAESSHAHMRNHLATFAGVEKGQEKVEGAPKRKRITIWTIKPSLAKIVEDRRLAA